MRYFTPQLWIAFQGHRRNAAFRTWARRLASYRKQLDRILPGLSRSARKFFCEPLILHDGTLARMELGDGINDIEGKLTRRDIVSRRKLCVRLFVLAEIVKRRRVTGSCWYVLDYKKVERVDLNFPGSMKLFPAGLDLNFGDWGYDELTSPKRAFFATRFSSPRAPASPLSFATFLAIESQPSANRERGDTSCIGPT